MRERHRFGALSRLATLLYILVTLIPVYWIIALSLMPAHDVGRTPPTIVFRPSLSNYLAVFGLQQNAGFFNAQVGFMQYYKHSAEMTVLAVALSVLLGVPAAFGLASARRKWGSRAYFFILSMYFMPPLAILMPLASLYRHLGLYDTIGGQVLVLQLVTLPLVVLVVYSFVVDIPLEVREAATLDGCDRWSYFLRVGAPLVRPGVTAGALLALMFAWQNFVFGFLLASQPAAPVSVGLLSYLGYESVLWGQMAAGIIIAVLPIVVIMVLANKRLVTGLSLGAVR